MRTLGNNVKHLRQGLLLATVAILCSLLALVFSNTYVRVLLVVPPAFALYRSILVLSMPALAPRRGNRHLQMGEGTPPSLSLDGSPSPILESAGVPDNSSGPGTGSSGSGGVNEQLTSVAAKVAGVCSRVATEV